MIVCSASLSFFSASLSVQHSSLSLLQCNGAQPHQPPCDD